MKALGQNPLLRFLLAVFLVGQVFASTAPPPLEQWLDSSEEVSSLLGDPSGEDAIGAMSASPGDVRSRATRSRPLAAVASTAVPGVSALLPGSTGPPRQHS